MTILQTMIRQCLYHRFNNAGVVCRRRRFSSLPCNNLIQLMNPTTNRSHIIPKSYNIHTSTSCLKVDNGGVHITLESSSSSTSSSSNTQSTPSTPKNNTSTDETTSSSSCSQGIPNTTEDEEEEQEEMFVTSDPLLGLGSIQEWGGPRRGGALKEPTRFGDWERKGRCSDF